MRFETKYIFCSENLVSQLDEVKEIFNIIAKVPWTQSKAEAISEKNKKLYYQEAYNRLFQLEFEKRGGWKPQPVLCEKPKLKGDLLKNDVFVEIQFGNSDIRLRSSYFRARLRRIGKTFV